MGGGWGSPRALFLHDTFEEISTLVLELFLFECELGMLNFINTRISWLSFLSVSYPFVDTWFWAVLVVLDILLQTYPNRTRCILLRILF